METNALLAIPPAFVLILGGLLLALIPRRAAQALAMILPFITLYAVWSVPNVIGNDYGTLNIAGFDLLPVHVHPFTHIFAAVFALAAFAGGLFALNQSKIKEIASAYVYAGSAVGVAFAGDFITLFIYWEIMAIASTLVLLFGGTEHANRSALRYAAMHFLGGILLMAGIEAYAVTQGSVAIVPLIANAENFSLIWQGNAEALAVWLILAGVLVNAAAPPFSAWLADSYPEASPAGAVFLSAFTTKTAVFTLLTVFAGNEILIYVGLFMVFYGIVFAILENDMRRILAYSIINQVGFMVTGAGIGTTMALYGAATHAFAHIIYKALLMMSAGSVLYMTGKRKCTDLGGLYHTMKLTMICGIIGALSISAFPWTSGFVSKSMISTAAALEHMQIVWLLLAAASAGVFLHAGIKFPWFVFFHRDSGMRPKEPPFNMKLAMVLLSIMCLVPGLFPELLYSMLPSMPDYEPYTGSHIVTQLQLLLFSGLAFFLMLPLLHRTDTISLDFDWVYRVFFRNLLLLLDRLMEHTRKMVVIPASTMITGLINTASEIHGPEGVMARNWSIGTTVFWITLLLGASLAIYYTML